MKLSRLSDERLPQQPTGGGPSESWCVRHASFPSDASQLMELHTRYSEQRFITIQRSERYWNEYVSQELGDTLWVLLARRDEENQPESRIVAWISIRKRGESTYQLREFGVDRKINYLNDSVTTCAATTTCWALKRLLGVAQAGESVGENGMQLQKEVSLLLPAVILSEIQQEMAREQPTTFDREGDVSYLNMRNVKEENDDGWMYVMIDATQPNVFALTTDARDPIPHLIWPTDSF